MIDQVLHDLGEAGAGLNAQMLVIGQHRIGQMDRLIEHAGAGADATASAVVADIIDVVRMLTSDPENRVPHLAFQANALSDVPILSMEEVVTAYYLKIHAADKPGVLADITHILGEREISIEAMIQKEPPETLREEERTATIIMLTHNVIEGSMNQAIREIEALDTIKGPVTRIRMEHLSR